MSDTSALSSVVDHSDSSSFAWAPGACGVFGSGVCGGVVAGLEVRASKSERARPRGRVGGCVRWRFGVEGRECAGFWWSRAGASSVSEGEEQRRRLRLLRGGVCGCGFVILAFGAVCDVVFFCCARGLDVRTIGLPRCGGARMSLGLGDRVGRLLARRDCSARHVLYMLEVGDWQVVGGGDSMVVVAGMWEAVRGYLRGAQSSDDGRIMLQSRLSECARFVCFRSGV